MFLNAKLTHFIAKGDGKPKTRGIIKDELFIEK